MYVWYIFLYILYALNLSIQIMQAQNNLFAFYTHESVFPVLEKVAFALV